MAKVTVYSSNTCPYCTAAKEFLTKNNVEFEERNISTDVTAKKELMKMGHMGVPVVIVGDEEVVGFDEPKLTSLLGL